MMAESTVPGRHLLKFGAPRDHALENLKSGVIFCQHYSQYNELFEFRVRILSGRPDRTKGGNP